MKKRKVVMTLSQFHSMPTYTCKGIEFNVYKVPTLLQSLGDDHSVF